MKYLFWWVTDDLPSLSRSLETQAHLDQARHPTFPEILAKFQSQLSSSLHSLLGQPSPCEKEKINQIDIIFDNYIIYNYTCKCFFFFLGSRIFFFPPFFGHPVAYGVPRPRIRSETYAAAAATPTTVLSWGWNLCPDVAEMPPIPLRHSGNPSRIFFIQKKKSFPTTHRG